MADDQTMDQEQQQAVQRRKGRGKPRLPKEDPSSDPAQKPGEKTGVGRVFKAALTALSRQVTPDRQTRPTESAAEKANIKNSAGLKSKSALASSTGTAKPTNKQDGESQTPPPAKGLAVVRKDTAAQTDVTPAKRGSRREKTKGETMVESAAGPVVECVTDHGKPEASHGVGSDQGGKDKPGSRIGVKQARGEAIGGNTSGLIVSLDSQPRGGKGVEAKIPSKGRGKGGRGELPTDHPRATKLDGKQPELRAPSQVPKEDSQLRSEMKASPPEGASTDQSNEKQTKETDTKASPDIGLGSGLSKSTDTEAVHPGLEATQSNTDKVTEKSVADMQGGLNSARSFSCAPAVSLLISPNKGSKPELKPSAAKSSRSENRGGVKKSYPRPPLCVGRGRGLQIFKHFQHGPSASSFMADTTFQNTASDIRKQEEPGAVYKDIRWPPSSVGNAFYDGTLPTVAEAQNAPVAVSTAPSEEEALGKVSESSKRLGVVLEDRRNEFDGNDHIELKPEGNTEKISTQTSSNEDSENVAPIIDSSISNTNTATEISICNADNGRSDTKYIADVVVSSLEQVKLQKSESINNLTLEKELTHAIVRQSEVKLLQEIDTRTRKGDLSKDEESTLAKPSKEGTGKEGKAEKVREENGYMDECSGKDVAQTDFKPQPVNALKDHAKVYASTEIDSKLQPENGLEISTNENGQGLNDDMAVPELNKNSKTSPMKDEPDESRSETGANEKLNANCRVAEQNVKTQECETVLEQNENNLSEALYETHPATEQKDETEEQNENNLSDTLYETDPAIKDNETGEGEVEHKTHSWPCDARQADCEDGEAEGAQNTLEEDSFYTDNRNKDTLNSGDECTSMDAKEVSIYPSKNQSSDEENVLGEVRDKTSQSEAQEQHDPSVENPDRTDAKSFEEVEVENKSDKLHLENETKTGQHREGATYQKESEIRPDETSTMSLEVQVKAPEDICLNSSKAADEWEKKENMLLPQEYRGRKLDVVLDLLPQDPTCEITEIDGKEEEVTYTSLKEEPAEEENETQMTLVDVIKEESDQTEDKEEDAKLLEDAFDRVEKKLRDSCEGVLRDGKVVKTEEKEVESEERAESMVCEDSCEAVARPCELHILRKLTSALFKEREEQLHTAEAKLAESRRELEARERELAETECALHAPLMQMLTALQLEQLPQGGTRLVVAIRMLPLAINWQNAMVVRQLLVLEPKAAEARGPGGELPLHRAARCGSPAVLEALLAVCPVSQLNDTDMLGLTPLHWAAGGARVGEIQLLAAAGADLEACTPKKRTALHLAAFAYPDVLDSMPYLGIQLKADNYGCPRTGYALAVRALVEAGANLEVCDDLGQTPLLLAAQQGATETLQELVVLGARTGAQLKDPRAQTALHLAAEGGHTDTVRVLLEAGVLPNVRDCYERTPLHSAAAGGHGPVCMLLLQAGADPIRQDMYGLSPFDLAFTCDIRRLLLQGANGLC